MPPAEVDQADLDRAERALRLTFRVVLPRMLRREAEQSLGYARPSLDKAFVRDRAFLVELARDLGEDWVDMVESDRISTLESRGRRIEREHMAEAAAELAHAVAQLPTPVRRVVTMRATGMSWPKIAAAMPDRVFFSIRDDWRSTLIQITSEHRALLMRLS